MTYNVFGGTLSLNQYTVHFWIFFLIMGQFICNLQLTAQQFLPHFISVT